VAVVPEIAPLIGPGKESAENPGVFLLLCLLLTLPLSGTCQEPIDHSGHGDHQMTVDPAGVVMNENLSILPRDCDVISREYEFTIRAGRAYAGDFPGMMFGMSQHEVSVQPCSRIEITFVNEDQVRHQWMVHGLPKYLYPAGMFHIEASGGRSMKGTFIVPGDDQTYLIHCDMAQHMEKGMRGQLVVGEGSGNLWGVAGVSDEFYRFNYLPGYVPVLVVLVLILAFFATFLLLRRP
jgi:plastocyanin